MTFDIRWTESSFRKLEKLDRHTQRRIIDTLQEAAKDPFALAKRACWVEPLFNKGW